MSTAAAEPAPPVQTASGSASSLLIGSLLGALIIVAGLVAAGLAADAVPESVPYLGIARMTVYVLVVGAAVAVGGFLAGRNPAPGVSGGIILTVSVLIATAFVAAAFAANFKDGMIGQILAGVTLAGGGFGVFRLLTSQTGIGWCRTLDEQGWASFHSHKRSQGKHVRRFTMIGILAIGVFGAVSLFNAEPFSPKGTLTANGTPVVRDGASPPLTYQVPFVEGKTIPLVPVADLTIPFLLILLTVWAAWRAVNVPVFGDFLIATEAEMNKVSWTSRKQLIKDTLVVLVFLLLLTLFLFVIDTFWAWLLSLKFIGVLPGKGEAGEAAASGGKLPW
jgi:preprotein translocase SecE subunit